MVELTQNKKLKRSGKPSPLKSLINRCNSKKKSNLGPSLGSGITTPIVVNSIVRHNDPYMPHKSTQRSSSTSLPCSPQKQTMRRATNSSTPQLVTHRSHQSGPDVSHYPSKSPLYHNHHNSSSYFPPLSPPPLSPTRQSFSTLARPTRRNIQRPYTYHPASSLSSTDDSEDEVDDDDDDQPLGLRRSARPFSPLSDSSEDGDEDLVPIARLSISRDNIHYMSAAEKYKTKVKARLHMDTAIQSTPLLH